MMAEFHFLRPYWFLMIVPLICLTGYLLKQIPAMHAWQAACDSHLLPYLVQNYSRSKRTFSLLLLLASAFFMMISLTGPTWSRFPVPVYQQMQPRVLLLDLSDEINERDLSPDRLSRAKFKLHDLLLHKDLGQFALIAYSEEPFVVSPLTDDGKTIDELLASLSTDIMPVQGVRLDTALEQAKQLVIQSGVNYGQILVLTPNAPDAASIRTAENLARQNFHTSILPIVKKATNPQFARLARAGGGTLLQLSDTSADLEQWIANTKAAQQYAANQNNDIPVWRDQGRWFLLPAILFLLPIFRRGWLQRLNS